MARVESTRFDDEPSPQIWLAQAFAKWEGTKISKHEQRWVSIVREASKQSVRSRSPAFRPLVPTSALAAPSDEFQSLVLDPTARALGRTFSARVLLAAQQSAFSMWRLGAGSPVETAQFDRPTVKMVTMSDVSEPTIFTRIVAREIPADIVFENDTVIAFRDIDPKAPVHLLVVPKTEQYRNVSELAAGDPALLAEVVATVKRLADEHCNGEFRLVFNEGEAAGQTVFHVHAHLLGAASGGKLTEGTIGQ